ncbi:hypothetical protein DERP_011924 [Dermatophagoides pteronyssinus]|uniref:Uncharacterized protein n=1 Tax=Dermatophagoides pteronyssinus TaxID=6956 RepID=A0ABQ8J2L8_DERPT|nr:hypothetical protein DERP_011924 [Dermatophagoides pteronyssinus]
MALQIISDYIADDYVKELRTIFGIPDIDDDNINQQGKEEIIKDNHHKRKLDSLSSSPAKKFQEKKQQVNDKNKKPRLTSTQKKLIKMDKTGIKDISCYFKKR